MTVAIGTRNLGLGPAIAIVGGVLTLVGALLAWEPVNSAIAAMAGESASQAGFEYNGGKIILVCGILALVVAALDFLEVKLPVSVPWTIVVLGAIASVVGVLNYFSITDDVDKGNAVLPGLAAVGVGLYVSILGAVVVLIGGIVARTTSRP